MALEEETTLDEIESSEALEDSTSGDLQELDIEVEIESEDGDEPAVAEPAPPPPPEDTEPEPADSTVTDADLEAGDRAYPESIKKRIRREIRIRKKIQEDFEQVRATAVQATQHAQARDNDLTAATAQIRTLQKQHADVLDMAFDKDIQLKRYALKAAREEGRSDEELTIQGELNTLQYQQNQIRDVKRTLASAPAAAPAPQAQRQAAPTQQPQQQAGHIQHAPPEPLAIQWLQKNNTWFSNPEYVGHKHFVLGVDAQLVKEGYAKNSPTYYAELDRRVDKAFPTLRRIAVPAGASSAPPVAPAGMGGGTAVAKNTVKLTRGDLSNMRRFGLDPANKAHLREYAMSKRSSV